MPVSLQTNGAPLATPPPHWFDLAAHFNEMRDCFATYLAMEGAEVVEGEKPGNLVNLVDRDRLTATDDPACCLRARKIPGKLGLRIGMGRC